MPSINSPEWWEEYFRTQWDANGGAAQTRHFMQRLIAELPPIDAAYLRGGGLSILDWGCAMGEGVDELAAAFPGSRVWGMDAATTAIEEARRRFPRHEFVRSPDGEISAYADVIVSSNCLEHFADPWPVAQRLARTARQLLLILVPHDEDPLCESHATRFEESSFPDVLGGKRLIARKRVTVDPRQWGGDQLMVIYASPDYLVKRGMVSPAGGAERDKWDRYYASAAIEDDDEVMARFGAEFAAAVSELLPEGGRVLEAGAGAGGHSLALARTGKFAVTVLDFSEQALRHARTRFARADLAADFVLADARNPGLPEYDLVFNSGVLEHFGVPEQVQVVRSMASRSRNLVLALVPNRECYWYWIWRIQAAVRGDWAFGSEIAAGELSSVFAAADLEVLGERVLGQDWTESF
ncbi:MAG: class I SAM-dependent methyltransferase, partial [Planctomycetota bacterium]